MLNHKGMMDQYLSDRNGNILTILMANDTLIYRKNT